MNSLLVGVGISDRATPGDDPVADAVTAEALGYEFVSAFDHPVAEAGMAEAIGYDAVPAAGHPGSCSPGHCPRPGARLRSCGSCLTRASRPVWSFPG